ncbi:unnamed protein product, partial [Didymodactylos carnosus]
NIYSCLHDNDLQRSGCYCNMKEQHIQCSSLPSKCLTCYKYNIIYFDEHVTHIPAEAFRYYDIFSNDGVNTNEFTIQFSSLNYLSSNSFSRLEIPSYSKLYVKIVQFNVNTILSHTFDDLVLKSFGILDIEIFNTNNKQKQLTFDGYSLDGIKYSNNSQFYLTFLNIYNDIRFQSNTGSIILPSNSHMKVEFVNFQNVYFSDKSFDHIIQERYSKFSLIFNKFQHAHIGSNTFYDMKQLEYANFYLNFANYLTMSIDESIFGTLTQLQSTVIISIFNISNDICFPSLTFSCLSQDINSTFQLQVTYGKNILFSKESFVNITQRYKSTLSLLISNCTDIYLSKYSIVNFHQQDQCLIDIWIKYSKNLIFDDYSIKNIDIFKSSILRIGFQYSTGTLQIASNAFTNINEGYGGELLFQIMESNDFYIRFNRSALSSLERLEIIDRELSVNDFCRIIDIPEHFPVKLLEQNQCSCTVYYLYRRQRKILNTSKLKRLVPLCYFEYSQEQLEKFEIECNFIKHVLQCREMLDRLQIHIPEEKTCSVKEQQQKLSKTISLISSTKVKNSSYIIVAIVIGCFSFGLLFLYVILNSLYFERIKLHFYHFVRYRSFKSEYCSTQTRYCSNSYVKLTDDMKMSDATENDLVYRLESSPSSSQQQRPMKVVVKYNSKTEITLPHIKKSDFLCKKTNVASEEEEEENIVKLNSNPLDELEDN